MKLSALLKRLYLNCKYLLYQNVWFCTDYRGSVTHLQHLHGNLQLQATRIVSRIVYSVIYSKFCLCSYSKTSNYLSVKTASLHESITSRTNDGKSASRSTTSLDIKLEINRE